MATVKDLHHFEETDLHASQTLGHGSLEAVLRSAVEAVGARCGAMALVNAKDHSLYQGLSFGPFPSLKWGMTVARWVILHGKPLALESWGQTSQIPGLVIDKEELLPLMCVPVHSGGRAYAVLQVNVPFFAGDRDISQKLHTLQLAANLLGCLLEKARLQHELQEKEVYVMRLVEAAIDAQEAERERICLEVHDGVAQTLASAFQYLQALENTPPSQETQTKKMVSRAVALVRRAIQEAREVINSLTPATLGDLGLVRTLRQELKQFQRETGIKVEFEAEWPRLAQDMEVSLYRIIHEAVTNVRKHAESRKVRIELSRLPDRLLARIKDWGVGFDPDQQGPILTRHSTGLFSMRKRAELLGGTCQVCTAPGQGTEIKVEVPIIE